MSPYNRGIINTARTHTPRIITSDVIVGGSVSLQTGLIHGQYTGVVNGVSNTLRLPMRPGNSDSDAAY